MFGASAAVVESSAQAQPAARTSTPVPLGGAKGCAGFDSHQWRFESLTDTHWKLTGQVEVECEQVKFFADVVDVYTDSDRLVASGNVVFTNPEGRISAEAVDFNTKTMIGTFKQASGILSLGPKADRSQFGGQDPDVYFIGDLVEKLGDRKYRVTHGQFTTCVQPTPRWELVSSSVVINLDDYAVLRNTVLRVKGVPMFYMPYAYYPLQRDQRATGFLLPQYGTSTLRGQALSNAFFWAMGRSQDLTLFHDWFTRTGQGAGTEYRYIANAGSEGTFRLYRFAQHAAEFTSNTGAVTTLAASRSFEINGNATQTLPYGLRSRVRLNYFSDLTTQQLYQGNVYDASRRVRTLGGTTTGSWGPYSLNATYQRNEAFQNATSSYVYGSTPRIMGTLAPRRVFGTPVYAGGTGEFAHLLSRTRSSGVIADSSLMKLDAQPSVRVPFSKLTFLTVNTSAAYRLTYYTESLDAAHVQTSSPLTRSYLSVRSDVIGPVFTRIFNTPNNSFAERFKHVIEPTFAFEQITSIANYRRVVVLTDASDFVVGGLTRLTYGVTNRVLARTRGAGGAAGQAREFLTASVQQTYYGSPEAAKYDSTYASSTQAAASAVSPIAITLRAAPSNVFDTTMRIEESVQGLGMQVFSLSSRASLGAQSVSASWSRRRSSLLIPPDSYLTASTALRMDQGRVTGSYAMNWDIQRGYVVSQTARLLYNAQCCGFGFEYQKFHFPQFDPRFPLPSDQRINFSFMLAGLGTFQNFFGAFGGPR